MIDIVWISLAFFLGLLATLVRLPPMIGHLAAGFSLYYLGIESFSGLKELSDLGISLLLFSIGLKLELKALGRIEVLGVALGQGILSFLFLLGVNVFFLGSGELLSSSVSAFGLSFSSTVFVFKILEDRGDFATQYGKIAIGVLVIQDIMAVLFMAFNSNKTPSAWLLLLIVSLLPLRLLLSTVLNRLQHRELLILFGLMASLGGSYLFDLVNVKGDLGALVLGVLLSKHPRAADLNRGLMPFKNFFLLGFFLSIGMAGFPSWEQVGISLILGVFIPLRGLVYFFLFNRVRLRSRNSFLAALALSNFSEFGLIVTSFAVGMNYLDPSWTATMALVLTFSFILSSYLNAYAEDLYQRYATKLKGLEHEKLHRLEQDISLGNSQSLVIGMGRVGEGAYEALEKNGLRPLGIDVDPEVVKSLQEKGHQVIYGNATNPDFWQRINFKKSSIKQILLAMPLVRQNRITALNIKGRGLKGSISSIAKDFSEVQILEEAGVDRAFNLYAEAGTGLAQSACESKN